MAAISPEYDSIDNTPGCGGWVVEHRGLIVWPIYKKDGHVVRATENEARKHASTLPGAIVHRVDLVLWRSIDKLHK